MIQIHGLLNYLIPIQPQKLDEVYNISMWFKKKGYTFEYKRINKKKNTFVNHSHMST